MPFSSFSKKPNSGKKVPGLFEKIQHHLEEDGEETALEEPAQNTDTIISRRKPQNKPNYIQPSEEDSAADSIDANLHRNSPDSQNSSPRRRRTDYVQPSGEDSTWPDTDKTAGRSSQESRHRRKHANKKGGYMNPPYDDDVDEIGVSEEEYNRIKHLIEHNQPDELQYPDETAQFKRTGKEPDEDIAVTPRTGSALREDEDDSVLKADILNEKIAAGAVNKNALKNRNKKYGNHILHTKLNTNKALTKTKLLFITVPLALVLLFVLIYSGIRVINPNIGWSPQPTLPVDYYPWAQLTPAPSSKEQVNIPITIDVSEHAKQLNLTEKRINRPAVFGTELLFSAGDGPIEKPVLTTLYLFDVISEKLTKIAVSNVKNGEIFQYFISKDWFVWLDTDHKGTNIIYKQNRSTGVVDVVREAGNLRPKLMLSGQLLVWMEQISETKDRLYLLDLSSEEDLVVQEFNEATYALSTPFIYNNSVVWAGPDQDQTAEEEKANPKSAIYKLDFTLYSSQGDNDSAGGTTAPQFTLNPIDAPSASVAPTAQASGPWTTPESDGSDEEELKPMYIKPGMYVHEPMYNGDVLIWIDKNKAPDSTLYMKNLKSGETKKLVSGVISYSLTDRSIIYNYNQEIYAYYYDDDVTVRVSQQGHPSILPVSQGNLVIWEDKSSGNEGDIYKYNILD